jgi:hypothetical protein
LRPTARIEAGEDLLRAGLDRAARLAGATIAADGAPSDLALRSVDAGTAHPHLDLTADGQVVVVTIASTPTPELWEVVRLIVQGLSPNSVDPVQCNPRC